MDRVDGEEALNDLIPKVAIELIRNYKQKVRI